MSIDFIKKQKSEKNYFLTASEGTRGEKDEGCIAKYFCVCKGSILLTPHFFNFGINTGPAIPKTEFKTDNFCSGIELNCQRIIWKIWMICKFYVTGGSEDTQLDMSTYYRHVTEQNMHKNLLVILFFIVSLDFRICPHPVDTARTWLGHFQLRTTIRDKNTREMATCKTEMCEMTSYMPKSLGRESGRWKGRGNQHHVH